MSSGFKFHFVLVAVAGERNSFSFALWHLTIIYRAFFYFFLGCLPSGSPDVPSVALKFFLPVSPYRVMHETNVRVVLLHVGDDDTGNGAFLIE